MNVVFFDALHLDRLRILVEPEDTLFQRYYNESHQTVDSNQEPS